ncbi:MAG: PadR family transcriptional regulator [Cyclobacteriaceae bacterium]
MQYRLGVTLKIEQDQNQFVFIIVPLYISFVNKKLMGKSFINELDELVLLSVGVLFPEAYAYGIRKEIKEQTGKSLSLASIHTVLYRLENSGLLKSELGGSTEKRGGRSKRLFSLTQAGLATLRNLQDVRTAMWAKFQPAS